MVKDELASGDQACLETRLRLINAQVVAIHHAADDISLIELEAADGSVLPSAEPGAHIEVLLPCGLLRHYSLINPDMQPRRYIIGVKRDAGGRGGSIYIHDNLRVGMSLSIGAPRNNFPLITKAAHSVLIAGGIGITPLISMKRFLERAGLSWSLVYAARSRQSAVFLDELRGLGNAMLHFDDEHPGSFVNIKEIIQASPKDSHFYCCGPQPLMDSFLATVHALGLSDCAHVEYFSATQDSAQEGGFVVELQRSKRVFSIPPGKSILDVLLEEGLNVAYSCTEGICGACVVNVISGTPDHRDSVLDDRQHAEGKKMTICCSGAKTERLIIDL